MTRTLKTRPGLRRLLRPLFSAEVVVLLAAVAALEFVGSRSVDDTRDIPWVLLLPLLFSVGCSLARYHHLPLTATLLDGVLAIAQELRRRLTLSLGLDFHPGLHPRPPAFTVLRRAATCLALAALVLVQAQGVARELLAMLRAPGTYTLYVLAIGAIWTVLLLGIAAQLPATFLNVLEFVKSRTRLTGSARLVAVLAALIGIAALLVTADARLGTTGCLVVLGLAVLLPSLVSPAEPPGGPWLNIALGVAAAPATAPLGGLLRQAHRVLALEAFCLVCLLAPAAGGGVGPFGTTDLLVRVYGWNAAWLFTGGALLAIGEFNRRRQRYDPAYPRSRVLWAMSGHEARALERERHAIEEAGWRLVVRDERPTPDDADLLVGVPAGVTAPDEVPLVAVPPALFLLAPDPAAVLAEADERAKNRRVTRGLERLLTSTRARMSEHGEGTFLVPHCWMVVGLTRDEDRVSADRPPMIAVGGSYQAALGTRLRRYLHEVFSRAAIDVIYVEDAVTVPLAMTAIERLLDRHVERAEPERVSEVDFVGLHGLRVVLHDVDPQADGLAGVDSHVTRHAISRARILIVSRDKRDDDDDDDPPIDSESSDDWLRLALGGMFPKLPQAT